MAQSKAPGRDSTELVGHVRSIHYALSLGAFTIMAMVVINQENAVTRAAAQLKQVVAIRQTLARAIRGRPNWDWLRSPFGYRLSRRPDDTRRWKFRAALPDQAFPAGFAHVVSVRFEDPTFHSLGGDSTESERLRTVLDKYQGERIDHLTLAGFAEYWDALGEVSDVAYGARMIPLLAYRMQGASEREWNWVRADTSTLHGLTTLRVSGARIRHVEDAEDVPIPDSLRLWGTHVLAGSAELINERRGRAGLDLALVVRYERVRLDAWAGLDTLARAAVPQRPYQQAFPDLAAQTSHTKWLELGALEDVFAQAIEREGERVEILGLKLPIAALSRWGIAVLCGLQMLLLLNLREVACRTGPDDPGRQAPWIGFYHQRLARVASVLSILVLPVLASVSATVRSSWRHPTAIGTGVECALIVVVTIVGWVSYRALRRSWALHYGTATRH